MAASVGSEVSLNYRHSPLSKHDNIRLVRLLSHQDEGAPIHCQIFEYPLQELGRQSAHAYEALSYVWGSEDGKQAIYIQPSDKNDSYSAQDTSCFHVTTNLHVALQHLRDSFFDRILWVDAICINQADDTEKGHQVQSMARIYASANRVIVWLGEAASDTDGAIAALCNAAATKPIDSSAHSSILGLLERPWFQRIWVVQEIAAARQILIKCGHDEMDGFAFCAGLDASKLSYSEHAHLRTLIPPITYLMRHVQLWPRSAASCSGPFSLQIRPLPHLVDMYHTRNATKIIDKIYGLLGMSTTSPGRGSQPLLADYGAQWRDVFRHLIRLSLPGTLGVVIRGQKESVAEIRVKGRILGTVCSVQENLARGDMRNIGIDWKKQAKFHGAGTQGDGKSLISFQASAKPIEVGDAVCLLGDAPEPTIIRFYSSYAAIIMIQAPLNSADSGWSDQRQRITSSLADFALVWDWNAHQYEQDQDEDYKVQPRKSNGSGSKQADPMPPRQMARGDLDKAVRLFHHGMLLNGMERYEESASALDKAFSTYSTATSNKGTYVDYLTQHDENEKILHVIHEMSRCGRASRVMSTGALHWAAEYGHEIMVELLLGAGVCPEARYYWHGLRQTALLKAALAGNDAVVKLLLDNGANIQARDGHEQTALLLASAGGHIALVKLLLEKGANIQARDGHEQTALLLASSTGYSDMVKLLLEKGADIEATGRDDHTALSRASERGHEAVVRLLLDGGAIIDDEVYHGSQEDGVDMSFLSYSPRKKRVALLCASKRGHEAVVKLLLDRGANIEARDKDGWTALSFALKGGHVAVAMLLLDRGATLEARYRKNWRVLSRTLKRDHACHGKVPVISEELGSLEGTVASQASEQHRVQGLRL